MVIDTLATYSEWMESFLVEIEAQPHNVAKGDVFVQKILQIRYDLSEADAIDATECAGAGDRGVDALYIYPSEVESIPHSIVIQGKYASAGFNMNVYNEAQKFLQSLIQASKGDSINSSFDKMIAIMANQGLIHYVIATVEPLDKEQKEDLENIKKLASIDFGDKIVFEAIDLKRIYNTYVSFGHLKPDNGIKVDLHCRIINIQDGAYIGVASLTTMYKMLKSYAHQFNDEVDDIYDRNIRKYLRRRTGSVNDGIYKTLNTEPQRFIAYNNGITIICRAAQKMERALQLDTPYIVNGCQTTRTLYNFMETKFPGIDMLKDTNESLQPYKESFMAFKVLVVENIEESPYTKFITRYSNKQNVIRGKDFIALDDMYKALKSQFNTRGYFLETQAGEYDVLPKHRKKILFTFISDR